MNKIISLIVAFIIIYLEFSIFAIDKESVGKIGYIFSKTSHNYFGYLAYVYLFIFIYILYKINFNKINALDLLLRVSTLLTAFISLIIFQALILKDKSAGIIGNSIVNELNPFIGNAGLWIFMVIGFAIFLIVFLEHKREELSSNLKNLLIAYKPKEKTTVKKSFREKTIDYAMKEAKKDPKKEKVTVKEVGDTAEISIETEEEIVKEPTLNKTDEEIIEEAHIIEENIVPLSEVTHALIVDELEENKKLLDEIELGGSEKPKDFKLPSPDFFQNAPKDKKAKVNEEFIDNKIADLLEKLLMFKIEGDVVRTYTGPIVTTFEFKPAPNVKVSKILNLQDDLAMALKAQTIRIQAPIPGKDI